MCGQSRPALRDVRLLLLFGAALRLFSAPQAQNPSPMAEHTRPHPRLEQAAPPGRRIPLDLGTLFIPQRLAHHRKLPLILHFHGDVWLPEVAASHYGHAAVIAIQLGSGSSIYAKPFAEDGRFTRLLSQAEERSGIRFDPVTLSSWSAGYGAVREILKQPRAYDRVGRILIVDGMHAGYLEGKPGSLESLPDPADLEVFLRFARDAVAGRKQMIITHSEIFPGTFASSTETADYLLTQLAVERHPALRQGPMGMQQLSEARRGGFRLAGYAGNSAPDHVDQLHAIERFWRWFH